MKPKIRILVAKGTYLEFFPGTSKKEVKRRCAAFIEALNRKRYYKKEIKL